MGSSSANANKKQELIKARPFVKWVGGKGQLLPELIGRVPDSFNTYHEPFIGGGALYFALQPKKAIISDINDELIKVYQVIRDDVDKLIRELKKHKHNSEYFYRLREVDRSTSYKKWSAVRKAARFIYLNKTCFNGLYRVNSKGNFNSPFGRYKNPTICDVNNLRACSDVLNSRGTGIALRGFSDVVKYARKYDFVYFDPPYAPLNTTSYFTSYSKDGFDKDMQLELKAVMDKLTDMGVYVMLSNSCAPLILDLYEKEYNLEKVKALRAVNSNASKRGKIDEVIVRNYD